MTKQSFWLPETHAGKLPGRLKLVRTWLDPVWLKNHRVYQSAQREVTPCRSAVSGKNARIVTSSAHHIKAQIYRCPTSRKSPSPLPAPADNPRGPHHGASQTSSAPDRFPPPERFSPP